LVPAEHHAGLIAVMNGGFKASHGGWGMRIGQDVFVPAREDGCTIGLGRDGGVRVAAWPSLAASEPELVAWRQTPPCLLESGVLDARLATQPRKWATSVEGRLDVRRSALGVDPSGRVAFYALGEEIEPKPLAVALAAAGAAAAAQLDINWSYTRFLLFGRPAPDAPLQVTATLIPKIEHARSGYVTKPSARDFFYLRERRDSGNADVAR
jgi:hypothetical protein